MKKIISTFIVGLMILINSNTVSYADVIKGDGAFYNFRIESYENVSYKMNTNTTSRYLHHTDAWQNAINKFSQIPNSGIGFNKVDSNDEALIQLSSCSSPKEEWLGIAKMSYQNGNNKPGKLLYSDNYLNAYSISQYRYTKEHIDEIALHELGHSFGLDHQPQGYENETLMGPYILEYKPANGQLKEVDKYNLAYAYRQKNDWQNHWASEQIRYAMNKGWVTTTDFFRPEDNITRAEFVRIFNNVFGLTKESGVVFNDTKNHWAKYEIDKAVTNGVCKGVSTEEFKPNNFITREEAASMISNYNKIADNNIDKLKLYADENQVSNWAKTSVEGVLEKGYMGGYSDKTFRPINKITRAEALVTLSRIK